MAVRAWGTALVQQLLDGPHDQRPVSNKLLDGPSAGELVEVTAMKVLAMLTQAGMGQAGTTQAGSTQAGTAQAGTTQIGMAQAGTTQIGMGQAGMGQAGMGQASMTQAGMMQAGMVSAGTAQAGMVQAGGGARPRQALDAPLRRQGGDAGPDAPPRMLLAGSGMGHMPLMSTVMVLLAVGSCLREG